MMAAKVQNLENIYNWHKKIFCVYEEKKGESMHF